jgi:hypothetical protein
MALLDDIKELIFKVENEKPEDEKPEEKPEDKKEVENEKVDKRKLIDEVGGILKGKVDDEIIRTIIGKLEKLSYDESEDGTADNKKVKNEEEKPEDKEKVEDLEKDEKDDVENKCGKSVKNSKGEDYYSKLMKIYNSSVSVKEKEPEYVSRVDREKAAEDYFKA